MTAQNAQFASQRAGEKTAIAAQNAGKSVAKFTQQQGGGRGGGGGGRAGGGGGGGRDGGRGEFLVCALVLISFDIFDWTLVCSSLFIVRVVVDLCNNLNFGSNHYFFIPSHRRSLLWWWRGSRRWWRRHRWRQSAVELSAEDPAGGRQRGGGRTGKD